MSVNRTLAKVILVHGTWGRGFFPKQANAADEPTDPRWFESGSKFRAALEAGLAGVARSTDFSAFPWSGANSIQEREDAASRLAETIDESAAASPEATHFIIAHSHGGNVALDARQKMSGDPRVVHIVTIATPFLSLKQRTIRLADKAFAMIASISVLALLIYSGFFNRILEWADVTVYISLIILVLSVLFGGTALVIRAYRKIIKQQQVDNWLFSHFPNSLQSISLQLLMVVGIALCASFFPYGHLAGPALILALPTVLTFLLLSLAIKQLSYNNKIDLKEVRIYKNDSLSNMAILRSRGDEATFALFFGRITSQLSRVAASISMIVSLGAMILFFFLLWVAIDYAISQYQSYQECVARLGGQANRGQCVIQGELILMFFLAAWIGGTRKCHTISFLQFIYAWHLLC
jgi:hypothetical protein